MSVELEEWRADPGRWNAVAYTKMTAENDDDANQEAREQLLQRLLRDRRASDVELLRYLLAQEILMHEAGWGIGEGLRLAAVLLCECGHAEDVWLLATAKFANFDTLAGLDGIVLFPAGMSETIDYVERSAHPDRDSVLEELREYLVHEPTTDQERRDRLTGLREYHLG